MERDFTKPHLSQTDNSIKIYHDLSSIKLLYDNLLDSLYPQDEYLVISDQQKWYSLDPYFFEAFIQKPASFDLKIRLILQNTKHARTYKKNEDQYNEKIKFLPKKIELDTNMIILPQKVIIVQTVEPLIAILIESRSVTMMNKALFNTIWILLP